MTSSHNRSPLIERFMHYNSMINLSAIRDAQGIQQKHINDSLVLLTIYDIPDGSTVVDIGTGGGFPLLPLAITHPGSQFIGIETRKKKMDTVNMIINECGVSNARVLWGRCEEHKKKYDIVTARAVTYIDQLMQRSYHLVKKGGIFIFYKIDSPEEKKELIKQCKKYHLTVEQEHHYQLPEDDTQRIIYILRK